MTAPPGASIAEGVGVYRAGNLCLCPVDVYQASTVEEIAAQIDQKWDYIIDSLTATGDRLAKLSRIDFKMDKIAPAENGLLPIIDTIKVEEDKLLEPGCYMEEISDYFNAEHISDGLPIIPPTRARYEKMLEYCPFDEDMVLCNEVGPTGKDITVRDVAIAAVMAGCKPNAMPVLITAFYFVPKPDIPSLMSTQIGGRS